MEPRRVTLDASLLKAIAHPLRLRILGVLRITGPSTASRLADQLGESSGLTSYHLRTLAAAGLVEEDPERGTGRDRWWRSAHDVSSFVSSDVEGTDGAAAAGWLRSYIDRTREQEVATWNAEQDTWPPQWRDVADRSDLYLLATPDELRGLLESVHDLLRGAFGTTVARRDGHEPVPDGAEHVRMHLLAFPVREAIGVRLASLPGGADPAASDTTESDDAVDT